MGTNKVNKKSPFRPPQSGQIIGVLVKTLGFGGYVFSSRTALRYFSGERIHDELAQEILKEFAYSLVNSHIIPVPPESASENKFQNLMFGIVKRCSERWDQIAGHTRSISYPVTRKDLAPVPYLRLAVIDLSFRIVGILRMNGINEYPDELPLWATEGGNSKFLREILSSLGDNRPTREEIQKEINVSDNTVDSWIDKGIRPSEKHLIELAKVLGERLDDTTTELLLGRMRRHYSLSTLVNMLTSEIGGKAVKDLVSALMRFINRILKLLKGKSESAAPGDVILISLSTEWKGIDVFLEHLWKLETDSVWREDLLSSYGKQIPHLIHVAREIGSIDEVKEIFKEKFSVSDEIMEKISKEVETSIQGDQVRPTPGTENMTRVHIKGDAAFSASNRMIQALQADAEGDFDSAILHLRRVVELQPQNAEYHFFLGATLGKKGEVTEGIQECWIAAQLAPEWDKPIVEVGIILMNSNQNQAALEHLEETLKRLPQKTEHLITNVGHARMRCNDFQGALEMYDSVIKNVPDHGLVLDRAAHCAFMAGDGNKGRSYAKKAFQLGFPETYNDWRAGKYKARG